MLFRDFRFLPILNANEPHIYVSYDLNLLTMCITYRMI